LIGAVALVLALVVFVPMLLDSKPRTPRESPVTDIPPKDNAPALPTPAPAKAPSVPAAAPPAPVGASEPVPRPKAEVARLEPKPAPSAVPAAAPPPGAVPAPRLEGFAVQVGAFRDEAKLKQAREKLVASGVVHYTERLDSSGGALTRLRAGPFATREAAESALATLKRGSLDGKVVPLP
jgi:DedD protein